MVEEPETADWRTIDELARSSGVTVRNIRAYQSRGLLPPPQVKARTGYYGPGHAARLELIQDLQDEGVKLDTIKKLLDTTGGSTEQVVQFIRTVRALFAPEDRQLAELAERYESTDVAVAKRGVKMGLLRELGDDTYEEISPRLMNAAAELTGLGIPITRSLDVVEQLRKHADAVAKLYVDLFLGEIWQPFDAEGRPDDQWPRVYETIERMRRISGEVMIAVLELAVAERVDVTFGRDIVRNVKTTSAGPTTATSEDTGGTGDS